MTRAMNATSWIGAVLIAALPIGCSERTDEKASDLSRQTGNAVERAGHATAEAGRDAGEAIKDATARVGDAVLDGGRAADAAVETLDVKAALAADARVDASNINVDSDHVSKTVTLKGHVPTAGQKATAEEIAVAKAVGYRVRNELTVGR